ncbi:MAG: TolB family protein, partial [Gammaproteobacteria bacterium]
MVEFAQTSIQPYLNVHSAMAPSFVPSGAHPGHEVRILFLMNASGVPQVWGVPIRGGQPTQMTFYAEAVRFVHCPPIGRGDRWIFGMDSGGSERTQIYLAEQNGSVIFDLSGHPDAVHLWGGWSPDGKRIAFSANR